MVGCEANDQQIEVISEIKTNWFHLENDIIDYRIPEVGVEAFAVYVVLRRFSGNKNGAWPYYKTLADMTGYSTRHIIRLVQKLEQAGWIKIQRRPEKSNIFVILDLNGEGGGVTPMSRGGDTDVTSINRRIPLKNTINPLTPLNQGEGATGDKTETTYTPKSEQPLNLTPQVPRSPLPLVIPEDLKADSEAILEWIAYKKEKGQSYKPRGLNALFNLIRAINPQKRSSSIRYSMGQSWQGIHEDRREGDRRDPEPAPSYWRPLPNRP